MSKIILTISILALAAFALANWQTQARAIAQQLTGAAVPQDHATVPPIAVGPTSTLPRTLDARTACPVTMPVAVADSEIPKDSWSDPIHSPGWYRSPDGKILAPVDILHVGGNKFGWLRPAGAQMRVTGRRLDRDAPPMGASIPCCYPGAFQVSGLYLPTGGCWEIEAKAEASVLSVVVYVDGPADSPVQHLHCKDLEDAVRSSDGIIVGKVVQTERDPRGYAWQSMSVVQVWENPYGGEFTGIDLLQGTTETPLEVRHTYLLFLKGDPFQTVCPTQTSTEVIGNKVISLNPQAQALWSGNDIESLQKEITALLSSH